jgi:hypothetical protein
MPIPIPMPIIASKNTIIMKTSTEITAITNAFIQPVSKKCLIKPSQTKNIIIDAIKPPTNTFTTVPIMIPRTTIQIASVNFALCLPAKALPTNQRIGAITIMATTICINKATKSISKTSII